MTPNERYRRRLANGVRVAVMAGAIAAGFYVPAYLLDEELGAGWLPVLLGIPLYGLMIGALFVLGARLFPDRSGRDDDAPD